MIWEVNQLCAVKFDQEMRARERVRDERLALMIAHTFVRLWSGQGAEA